MSAQISVVGWGVAFYTTEMKPPEQTYEEYEADCKKYGISSHWCETYDDIHGNLNIYLIKETEDLLVDEPFSRMGGDMPVIKPEWVDRIYAYMHEVLKLDPNNMPEHSVPGWIHYQGRY